MESSSMATRLRRPFAYDSDNSLPEALDEQEQETLIETLTTQNTTQNATYTKVLTLLPLLAAQPHIFNLSSSPPLPRLLSISCLLTTAYLSYILPPEATGLSLLDSRSQDTGRHSSRGGASGGRAGRVGRGAQARDPFEDLTSPSPAKKYLPYLTLALALSILLLSLIRGGTSLEVLQGCLPALVYGVVVGAKLVMAGVDPDELRGLKYDYKGA